MILHLMINSKISEEFIKYLNKNFDISEHNIIVWNGGNSPNINLENLNGVTIIKTKKDLLIFYLKFFRLNKYKKLLYMVGIFHVYQ